MEFYYFYNVTTLIAAFFAQAEELLPIYGVVGGALLWTVAFVMQGVGISKMAKNRGLKRRWLAFVPFANIWYLGKLSGECQFFGQKLKKAGIYTMISQIAATLFTLATIGAEVYLWTAHGAPQMESELGSAYWPGLTGFSLTVSRFYDLSGYMMSIFQLICEIFLLILLMSLYKRYEPKSYFALSMLTLFVPVSRFFIVFALRNRRAIDYEAYMRARREAYARRQQQYYNPYNNPYNRGGNPYGSAPNGQNPYARGAGQTSPKPEEPFSEFSSDKNSRNASGQGGDTDGFFD